METRDSSSKISERWVGELGEIIFGHTKGKQATEQRLPCFGDPFVSTLFRAGSRPNKPKKETKMVFLPGRVSNLEMYVNSTLVLVT
jgi:hypothetical protein